MNETIKHQLDHRTMRFFKDEPVSKEKLEQYLQVMRRTATSVGLQSYSVIRVTDPKKREELSKVANQAYLKDVPELFIFIVDCYRIHQIAKEKDHSTEHAATMDRFFQGIADAYLAAQNMTNAIESDGLGAVYFGSILNDPAKTVEILDLPPYTFPIVGLGFGNPDDNPESKPRMSLDFLVGENGYPKHDHYVEALADFDEEMTHYYDTRTRNQRHDSYTNSVLTQLDRFNPKRAQMLRVIKDQGFDLGLEDK